MVNLPTRCGAGNQLPVLADATIFIRPSPLTHPRALIGRLTGARTSKPPAMNRQ
jgi:hypothetical protein